MEFGIAVATAADSWKVVKRAEELGFSHAWFYDTQMLCADCFVAMGAAAVQIGRPYVYGLAAGGAPGVTHVLKILRQELLMAMSLLGCRTIASIDRSILWK